MKLPQSSDAFNVVILGAWNPAIFSPEWVKANLANDQARDVILSVAMPPGLMPNRLTVDDMNLYVSSTSLVIDYVSYTDGEFHQCAEKMQVISNLLLHTPINAVGINFRFVVDVTENANLLNLFDYSDAAKINSTDFVYMDSLLKRSFRLEDSSVMNLSLSNTSENILIEFNYHSDVKNSEDLKSKITLDKIKKFHETSIKFLTEVYGLVLEES